MKNIKHAIVFSLVLGLFLMGSAAVFGQTGPTEGDSSAALDQTIFDDLIVSGSGCFGYDCVTNENFGFDSIILKENNIRIFFNDTSSTSSFPTTDWRISVNDTTNGGKSYFRIDDVTNAIGALTIRDGGNVGIGTDDPASKLHVAGDITVDGVVNELSDVNAKREITPISGEYILGQLSELPLATWSYKSEAGDVRHMGPMAQDFYAAFGLGVDERHLSAVDTGGVALAAVQELHRQVLDKEARIDQLERENSDLEARLDALEALVADLQND